MLARRHDGRAQSGGAYRLDEAHGAFVRLDAACMKKLDEAIVLASGELAQLVIGQRDVARREKRSSAVDSQLAVDIARVVGALERDERVAGPFRSFAQVLVEQLLPRRGVDFG